MISGEIGVNRDLDNVDWISPICMLALAITGVFFIYSVQSYSEPVSWYRSTWIKQIIFIVLGMGVYLTVSFLNYKFLMQNAHYFYIGSILLLLALETPLGVERFHARRWLNFKFILFQPSETAKIGFLIMAASLLSRSEIGTVRESIQVLIKITIAICLPILLIFRQPDLGSALVFPPMIFSLLYVSKLSKRFFAAVFVAFVALMGVLSWDLHRYYTVFTEEQLSFQEDKGKFEQRSWVPLRDYQRNRILAFVAPEAIDPYGRGVSWNRKQSLISVGSGGFAGKGHGEGTQAKLGYLPQSVAHNDFIFSVIAEEKGLLGSLFVIGVFAILIFNGLRIASMARDRFGMLLATGVTVVFIVHVFVNIGMTIGLMPITGLPLPFLSYGGSFIISCCILQGLIQSVYRFRKDFS